MKQFGVVIIIACFVFALLAESSLCSLCTKTAGTCPMAKAAEPEETEPVCGSSCGGCGESQDSFPLMAQKLRELRERQEQTGCSQCPSRRSCAADESQPVEAEPYVLPPGESEFALASCCAHCLAARINQEFTIIYIPVNDLSTHVHVDRPYELVPDFNETIVTIDYTLGIPPIAFSTVLRC